ncbi:MAG: DsrE family protein [Bacteroidales bacterium]
MEKVLILINDAPYGSEKAYNALRLAMQIQKEHENTELCVFLMADAVTCALPNQNTPNGYYNIERMLKSVINKKGKVKLCGTCADARGLKEMKLIEGAEISTMKELTQWTLESNKVVTF